MFTFLNLFKNKNKNLKNLKEPSQRHEHNLFFPTRYLIWHIMNARYSFLHIIEKAKTSKNLTKYMKINCFSLPRCFVDYIINA